MISLKDSTNKKLANKATLLINSIDKPLFKKGIYLNTGKMNHGFTLLVKVSEWGNHAKYPQPTVTDMTKAKGLAFTDCKIIYL